MIIWYTLLICLWMLFNEVLCMTIIYINNYLINMKLTARLYTTAKE